MGNKKAKEITNTEVLSNNLYILKLAWKIHPQRVIVNFVKEALGQFGRLFFSVIFIKYLLEALDQGKSYQSLALFIVASTTVSMLISLFNQWYAIQFKPISDTIIYEKLYGMLFRKAAEVELDCYEDSEFYNKYTLAIKEADTRMQAVIDSISGILFAMIAAVSVFGVMFSIDRYVVLFAIFPIIGDFVFGKKMNGLYYNRAMDNAKNHRKMDYVNRTLYLSNYAKEIRLSNIFHILKRVFNDGYEGVIGVLERYKGRMILVDVTRNVLTFLVIFQGVLFYGAYLAMIRKSITISEFAVLASAMVSGAWILIGMARQFISVFENGMFIQNLRRFLEHQSKMEAPDPERIRLLTPEPTSVEIKFHKVSFSYRGSEEPVMRDINLVIPHRAKIALVGHNGAGKTTFIKLLMRLYDPTSGTVTLNDKPLTQYPLQAYRDLFGAAFQDYQVFAMTIAENVLMRELQGDEDRRLVEDALKKSGVYNKVMSLPLGIDTMLTREFDDQGVNLSGGELQKIAIARIFAKDSPIVIMDEPSSALDPIAEYQLYESVAENCAEKTVIFISHRLSSAVIADRIYLFEDGAIIEEGTHQQLMQMDGRYAEMFRKQSERYVEAAPQPA